ncbi:MAG TPA: T9SS type A sorting domain-containing protein [Bacteroidales bacterium]|nr:T9SS type A sorting domain-containing protein [Bacteroidales bacterium]
MKKYLLLILTLWTSLQVSLAQTTLYTTDFESDTIGRLAIQAGDPWTTWSGTLGGGEDPFVSNTQAHSGIHSVYVVNNNDCVLNLYDKTTGRFKVQWYMYVESGKLGYFNLLSDFSSGSSTWAFQAYIYHDTIFIDADGYHTAMAPFASDTWAKVTLIIDLDDDFATFFKDDVEIISYQWSKGAQGSDNLLKLDGIDFYGWDGTDSPVEGTPSGYYIDDVSFDSIVAPGIAPSNLTATLNSGDIDVAWTASAPAPDLYKLSRNGAVVHSTSGLSYTDVHPWPDTYIYAVRAKYDSLGYSHASNSDTATITGGVSRDLVLMEKGTSTNCPYCPYAAMGYKSLIETNHKDAAGIAYHPSALWNSFEDAYTNSASVARLIYYNIEGFPTVISDGKWRINGVTGTTNQYSVYLNFYNDRIDAASFHTIDLNVVPAGTDTYTATITAEESFTAFSPVKLHVVLTESNIPVVWYSQSELDYVCRGMYPDANGTTIDFSTQNPQTFNINFSTSGYVKDNCQLIVFIQDPASKLVTQTVKLNMSAVSGMDELSGKNISLYPNPASEYVIAHTSGNGQMEIFDITGKCVLQDNITQTSQTYDVRGLEKGIYFVRITTKENSFSEKLIID